MYEDFTSDTLQAVMLPACRLLGSEKWQADQVQGSKLGWIVACSKFLQFSGILRVS